LNDKKRRGNKIFTKDENGSTKIDVTIIPIAFVIVVAVLSSYVMLGAGYNTTQKSQDVVHIGVMHAGSCLVLSGDVIARGHANVIDELVFYVKNFAGGTSIDLEKMIITYADKDDFATTGVFYSNPNISVTSNYGAYYTPGINKGGATNLIKEGDTYKIVVRLVNLHLNSLPSANEVVKLEVSSPESAVIIIQRTMPPSIIDEGYQFYSV
jgi:archaeal flagellin FlaB